MKKKIFNPRRIAITILTLFFLVALFQKWIAPYSEKDFSFDTLLSPSFKHFLGTDEMGYDIFTHLIYGLRNSIFISLATGVLSLGIAFFFSVGASYYGGILEKVLFQIISFLLIVPEIIFIMFISVHIEPSILGTIFIITLFSWVKGYKIIKLKIDELLKKEKIRYTILLKGNLIDLLRKIFPDLKPVLLTVFMLQCNKAIMYETSLSFLGIGNPSIKTWGRMIKKALESEELFSSNLYMWYLFPVILLIFLYLFCLSILGMEGEGEE